MPEFHANEDALSNDARLQVFTLTTQGAGEGT